MSNCQQQNKLKPKSRVEVRWLRQEAESYMKQWQRRFNQMTQSNDNQINYNSNDHQMNKPLTQLEQYDDWQQTAKKILDLDLNLLDTNTNCMMQTNTTTFNSILEDEENHYKNLIHHHHHNFIFDIDEDEDEYQELKSNLSTSTSHSTSTSSSSTSASSTGSKSSFKRRLKAKNPMTKTVANPMTKTVTEIATQTPVNNPKNRSLQREQRRQLFKCVCGYQSDRNFNFLRHQKTCQKNANKFKNNNINYLNNNSYQSANNINSKYLNTKNNNQNNNVMKPNGDNDNVKADNSQSDITNDISKGLIDNFKVVSDINKVVYDNFKGVNYNFKGDSNIVNNKCDTKSCFLAQHNVGSS